jgi:amidase
MWEHHQRDECYMITPPSVERLAQLAERYNLPASTQEILAFSHLIDGMMESFARLDELPGSRLEPTPGRRRAWVPHESANALGAWASRTEIESGTDGPLNGKSIAIKDSICVAGVPMSIGSRMLEGFVPDGDATVVARVLSAGASVIGKATCEAFCFSGGSHTSEPRPVLNPHDRRFSAGGSSSGNAALIAAGEVDMGIGGDQGGSIRIPSSWCGVFGLKPTYGLVPYTGVYPYELTLDHIGPMARTVRDVALLLDVIAGPDGQDPRQSGADVFKGRYLDALEIDARSLRIGVVAQGFQRAGVSEASVDDAVTEAARAFSRLGCTVDSVSIPWHIDGYHIYSAIGIEGPVALAWNGAGSNWKGRYSESLIAAVGSAMGAKAEALPDNVKLLLLLGHYLQDEYHGLYYAKAQNLVSDLSRAYDLALRRCDLLVLPTVPMKPTALPAPDASTEARITRTMETDYNTGPFDVTGHPAMNVPCAMVDGLPIGMMLVGNRGDDATVLRAAAAYEREIFAPILPDGSRHMAR